MSDQVDHSRRRLLTAATVGTGAIGVAFAAVPFLASWQPSARAKALGAPVEVDASKLDAGQMLKVVWRGQAVFVVRRVKGIIDQLGGHDALLAARCIRSEQFVSSRGSRFRGRLAGRLLLSVPWLQIRSLGACFQEHAGAEEPDRSTVCICGRCANHNRRRRRPQESLATRG